MNLVRSILSIPGKLFAKRSTPQDPSVRARAIGNARQSNRTAKAAMTAIKRRGA